MAISVISAVTAHSPAYRMGVQSGEQLISINAHRIVDVLDYKFYSYEASLTLQLKGTDGTRHLVVEKEEGEDLGLEFETYLMDKPRSCANDCVFCFVDQMPQGMRETLYFKDDDARLSFLTGNYITLTNLSQREVQRIVDLKISPINISVHATNPEVRTRLLGHPKAGDCLDIMKRFAQGGVTMNCQIVSCPQYNDGEELRRSLQDLAQLYPQVNSISVVPVGLTKYRENLPLIQPYHKETAQEVVTLVESFAEEQLEALGTRLAWCSDEFYLIADQGMPHDSYYEDYTQWENGVGMLAMFRSEFLLGLKMLQEEDYQHIEDFSIATGTASGTQMTQLVELVTQENARRGLPIHGAVYPIRNDFFGHTVTVSGLITGQDLVAQLKGMNLGKRLLIPDSMLRHGEAIFLDDMTLAEVESQLQIPVIPLRKDGGEFVDAIYDPLYTGTSSHGGVIMTQEAYDYNPPK